MPLLSVIEEMTGAAQTIHRKALIEPMMDSGLKIMA